FNSFFFCYVFFFYCYGDLRDLHSFPTRRSSDLLKKNGRVVVLDLLAHRFEKARELYADHWLGFSEVQLHQLLESAGFKEVDVRRSEEHTSELQSPYDLVCRLLLEKKKHNENKEK